MRGFQRVGTVMAALAWLATGWGLVKAQEPPRAPAPNWSPSDLTDTFFEDAFQEAFGDKSPWREPKGAAPADAMRDPADPISAQLLSARKGQGGNPTDWDFGLDWEWTDDEVKRIAIRLAQATRSPQTLRAVDRDSLAADLRVAAILLRAKAESSQRRRFQTQGNAASRALVEAAKTLEAKLPVAYTRLREISVDMQDLVSGNRPFDESVGPPKWKSMIRRYSVMHDLDRIAESSEVLDRSELNRQANRTVVLLLALQQVGLPDSDNPGYQELAKQSQLAAAQWRDAAKKGQTTETGHAFARLQDTCNACHEEFQ